jgi:hypothetical protein
MLDGYHGNRDEIAAGLTRVTGLACAVSVQTYDPRLTPPRLLLMEAPLHGAASRVPSTRLMRLMRLLIPSLAALCLTASASTAQVVGFVTHLGVDTVAFERAEWKGGRLTGTFVQTLPKMRVVDFSLGYRANGMVGDFTAASHDGVEGPGARPRSQFIVEFRDDSVVAITTRAGKTDTARFAADAAPIPYLLNSWSLMEVLTRRAVKTRPDSIQFGWYNPGNTPLQAAAARWYGDSLSVDFSPTVLMLRVDKSGKLLGADGRRTTIKVVAERHDDLDLAKLVSVFADRERAAGRVAAALSPRDTVRASIGGADLLLDYGRPSRRGREIWGAMVPYGDVWRTGANAATQFSTSKPLEFQGGPTIPAGKYTLWSIPAKDGFDLIINKQVGQWGTQYNAANDLVRFHVAAERVPAPGVEQMVMAIDPRGNGGVLRMTWDRVQFSAPFTVL